VARSSSRSATLPRARRQSMARAEPGCRPDPSARGVTAPVAARGSRKKPTVFFSWSGWRHRRRVAINRQRTHLDDLTWSASDVNALARSDMDVAKYLSGR